MRTLAHSRVPKHPAVEKDFGYLIVPGAGHVLDDSAYFNRRRRDFFARTLLNVEPPPYSIGQAR